MPARPFGSVFAGSFILFCAGTANASLITDMIGFDITGFVATQPGSQPPVPQNTVAGSVTITFDPSQSAPITPVDAINLTIAGHTYSISEVNFEYSLFQNALVIGAGPGGNPNNIVAGDNNFQLAFEPVLPLFTFFSFEYTTSSINSTAYKNSQVPEPGSFALLGVALAGFGIIRRRRKGGMLASMR
jgi:hypothetical protein